MHYLSGKEKKELKNKLPQVYEVNKKDNLYFKGAVLYKEDIPYFIIKGDLYIPHLKSILSEAFKAVYIDHGAVPFLMKGADIMRPGISEIEDGFLKNEIILIKDEIHKKTLGVGMSLYSSEEMKKLSNGKVLKVLHHMKDEFYVV